MLVEADVRGIRTVKTQHAASLHDLHNIYINAYLLHLHIWDDSTISYKGCSANNSSIEKKYC
jgi:hypothetical protein